MSHAPRTFDARVIGALTTGTPLLAGSFAPVHEAAEHILGHRICSHEFTELSLWIRLRVLIAEHHPHLPTDKPDDHLALAERLLRDHPDGITLPHGTDERSESAEASAARLMAGAGS